MRIRLAYHRPWHSKHNAIEHCWGVLERPWNGALLSTAETALRRAQTLTWKGLAPVGRLTEKLSHQGGRLTGKAEHALEARLPRATTLPWHDILIPPTTGEY